MNVGVQHATPLQKHNTYQYKTPKMGGQSMSSNHKNLYIGVKNDLSPFEVDLKALTRGLVVVGQSGCGKSF